MALIRYYKLDGNLYDEVTGTYATSTLTEEPLGKIGSCYRFTGGSRGSIIIGQGSDFFPIPNLTVAMWFKTSGFSEDSRDRMGLFSMTYGLTLAINKGTGSLRIRGRDFTHKDILDDKWHHVAFTSEAESTKVYLDGELIADEDLTWTGETNWPTNTTAIGNEVNNNLMNFNGLIDEFRMYDHVLSAKEIYELSLAKVLHYDFDNPFVEESDNLVSIRDITASGLTVNLTNRSLTPEGQLRITSGDYRSNYTSGSLRINVPLSVLEDGETYTMAVRYKETAGNPDFSFMDWGDTPVTQRTITDGPYKIAIGTGTRSVYTSTFRFMDCRINSNSEILIYDVQLQKGDHYAEIANGYREPGLIYDKSGYGHLGTQWTKRPRLSEDAALGSHSIEFDGADNTDAVQLGNVLNLREEISLSVWIKYGPTPSGGVFVRGNNGGWASNSYMFLRSSGSVYRLSFSNGSEMLNYSTPSSLGDNEWHHVVATFDQEYFRVYIDGEQTYETANTIGLLNGNNSLNTFLGAGYTTTVFDGLIDDMRVYAKALEAKDVEILYKTRASFDNTGNIFIEEISNTPEMKKALEVQPNGGSHSVDWAIDFKPNKDIIIKSALIRPYFTGDLTVTLREDWGSAPVQEVTIPVTSGVVQRVELNIFCKKDQQVKLGRANPSSTPLMREATNTLISELSNEDIEFFPSAQVGGTSYADRIYYFFDWEYEIVDKININSTGTMTFNEINQIDHNLNQETTKQRLKEDGTLEIDGYIIQN